MVTIRKQFIDLKPILNDDIQGIKVSFDEETAFYTVRCGVKKFKWHRKVRPEFAFQHYIQRRVIRKLDLVCINGDEPEVSDGRIQMRFQLCG